MARSNFELHSQSCITSCLHLTTLNLWSQDHRRHLAPMGIGSMIYEAHPTHCRYHIRVNTCTSSPYHYFRSLIYLFRTLALSRNQIGRQIQVPEQGLDSSVDHIHLFSIAVSVSVLHCFTIKLLQKRNITSDLPQSSITTHTS